jgi:hypothetical protein
MKQVRDFDIEGLKGATGMSGRASFVTIADIWFAMSNEDVAEITGHQRVKRVMID